MTEIQVESASITVDEGDLFYRGTFVLANYLDSSLFSINTVFTFDVNGEVYSFIVENKNFDKRELTNEVNWVVTLNCVSPAVKLTSPRALPITKTWPSTTALAVVTEVLAGYSFEWKINDWPLTNNLFSVSEQAPLDIVSTLVSSVGAVVESLPNGNLVIRYRHPVSVPLYGPATFNHSISESDHVVAGREGFTITRILDRFRIMNSQAAQGSDRMEFTDLESGNGKIFVYPNPWRTAFTVSSTRTSVFIGPQIYDERSETETIEIVNGKGSVRYPVLSVVAIDFLDADLTGVSYSVGSSEIETTSMTSFYSLLKITYKVRSLVYNVVGIPGQQAQFLMEE